MYLDTPSTTSQITYKFQLSSYGSGAKAWINRSNIDRDTADYDARSPSSITVMEIAA